MENNNIQVVSIDKENQLYTCSDGTEYPLMEGCEDFTIEELLYLFPIDVWIKEFISELKIEPMEEYPSEKQYDNLKKEDRELGFDFIHYCINNNLDIRKLDAGIWFYCARVVGSKERLKYILNQDSANILKEEYQLRFKYCPDM